MSQILAADSYSPVWKDGEVDQTLNIDKEIEIINEFWTKTKTNLEVLLGNEIWKLKVFEVVQAATWETMSKTFIKLHSTFI